MGHMLKNTVFKSGSYALGVPNGTNSVGPSPAANGQTRYNTGTGKLEFYNNTVWNAVAREGNVVISKDSFSGNSLRSNYGPLSSTYAVGTLWAANILVHVGTVYQIPGTNYSFAANAVNAALTDISFISNPSNLADITIIHGFASTIAS
jgi:hypothetical protein